MDKDTGPDPQPVTADASTAQGPSVRPPALSTDQSAESSSPQAAPQALPKAEDGPVINEDTTKRSTAATDTSVAKKEPEPEPEPKARPIPGRAATTGPLDTREEPAPSAHVYLLELPGDDDDLWKAANDLAKSLIETQRASMDETLDTMLIFVSFEMR